MQYFQQGKNLPEIKTTYHNNRVKEHHMVKYHSKERIHNLSEESIAMKSLKKISTKLQFLHSQNEYLTPQNYLGCWVTPYFNRILTMIVFLGTFKLARK